MALPSTAVWEVRTASGSDSNGGGFNAARGGVDYTQQDSPQATGTVTVSGTTCTATSGIFTSLMVGNMISDGTSWREITAFTSATVVTLDATVSWSSTSIKIGGAMATFTKVNAVWVIGNECWMKGTEVLTTGLTITGAGSGALWKVLRGYGTTRGDGVKAIFSTSAAIQVITLSTGYVMLSEVHVDGGGTATGGILMAAQTEIYRCSATNTQGVGINVNGGQADSCEVYSLHASATFGIVIAVVGGMAKRCFVHDLSCPGFEIATSGNAGGYFEYCVAARCSIGFRASGSLQRTEYQSCVAYGNSSHGFSVGAGGHAWYNFRRCIAVNNGGFGISALSGAMQARSSLAGIYASENAFYGNTSGDKSNLVSANDVTLTGDPFVNAASNDFALNNTSGAGAPLRNVAQTRLYGTTYQNIGPLQHAATGAGGVSYSRVFTGL